ncbi:TPA: antitermination N domain protein [Escherichia coli]|nr:antitermination N domain protein [Escherichia coli]
MQWKYLPAKRSRLRGRLPEIKTIDGEVIMGQEEKYELKKLIEEDAIEEIAALTTAIKNIRYALNTLISSCDKNSREFLILGAALGIVDAATLHLITHDDILIEPYETLLLVRQKMADAAANGDLQLYIDLRKVLRRMVRTEGDIPMTK